MSGRPLVGVLSRQSLQGRLDPRFLLTEAVAASGARWGTIRLGDLATRIQYGSSTLASSVPTGTPMLRMNNIKDDAWDFSEVKYVTLGMAETAKYQLEDGDILINRTNGSRDLVGKSQVFHESGRWVFASYLIRVTVDTTRASPDFISAFLNSDVGRAQVTATSRQSLQTNVSATELRNLRVPLPPLDVQRSLVTARSAALAERMLLEQESGQAVTDIGAGFTALLGLGGQLTSKTGSFLVPLSALAGRRLDASFHRPQTLSSEKRSTAPLKDFAQCDPKPLDTPQDVVPYVGLPQCDNLDVSSVVSRPFAEVRARKSFRMGDLLIARIEPSIFNRKYPWARNNILAGSGDVYTSTEFYVLRSDPDRLAYLLGALRSQYLQSQIEGRTTGTSGRRRLDKAAFLDLAIPEPSEDELRTVAEHVSACLNRAQSTRSRAREVWADARRTFERQLEGALDD